LNTEAFLNLQAHLNALPSFDNPRTYFDKASVVAKTLVRANNAVTEMLQHERKQ